MSETSNRFRLPEEGQFNIQNAEDFLNNRDRGKPLHLVAGSYDPSTYGHAHYIGESLKTIVKNGHEPVILSVRSTSKPEKYQLFETPERANLLLTYPVIAEYNPTLLYVVGETKKDVFSVLERAHQAAEVVYKGRRTPEDTIHSNGLIDKYGMTGRIHEVQAPEGLEDVSSGYLKGIIAQSLINGVSEKDICKNLHSIANPVIIKHTIKAMQQREHKDLEIFTKRLAMGSSEAMFDKK